MIEYEGRVFRPPSEAYSLIVQVTIGCSHNKCTFCDMYKEKRFRVRKLEEVKADFDEARRMYRRVGRIFLADGDALMCRPEIVFADEPTGNLDALTGAEILKLLFEVNDAPFACVMVTHSQDAAARCDRTLTLEKGRIS